MTDENPYTTPNTTLDTGEAELYQAKIISFNGRIGCVRYLAYGFGVYLLLILVLAPIMGGVVFVVGDAGMSNIGALIIGVFSIAAIVVSVMFGKRRLNDMNRSGWWILLYFIPLVNLMLAVCMILFPGTDGSNNFGPAPTANSLGVKILASMLIIFIVATVATVAILVIAIPQYADYTQRAQVSAAVAAAARWKTSISLCAQEQGAITNTLCGTPGTKGVPADVGAGIHKYVTSITTTGAGVVTVTSTGATTARVPLVVIITPTLTASGVNWALTGNGCTVAGRSINCSGAN